VTSQRPLVVTRRWDQLGGRLCAIINARSIAELLDLEFRFVWPRGPEPAMSDPRQIFSQSFLDTFEIEPAELENRPVVRHHELISLSRADARRALGADAFVEVNEVFGVISGPSEGIAAARTRYRRCYREIGWSDDVRRLADLCSSLPGDQPIAGIHVRAGDIVTGGWRHVVAHEKYSPTPFIEYAIDQLAHDGDKPVLVLSDNGQYLAWLKDRFPTVLAAADVVPGYAQLPEVQQALADIFVLSACEPIIGPPSSSFSRLAANLGPGELRPADTVAPAGQECAVLCAGIAAHRQDAATARFWRGLVARDICWCLDVFADTLALDEQHQLAGWAVELDPDFLGAHTRFARIASLAGDWRPARIAVARAIEIAASAERYDDPLMEALITDVVCRCLAAVRGRRPRHACGDVHQTLDRCLELHPVWLARDETAAREEIFGSLRFMLTVAERLSEGTRAVRKRAARSLAEARYDDLDLARLRPDGLQQHRSAAMYDPLVRDLERMALHLYDAVHRAGVAVGAPSLSR